MNLKPLLRAAALVIGLGFVVAAGWMIWRQTLEVHAPREAGVCWRQGKDGRFVVFYRNIDSIETCAALLERVHMTTGEDLEGAYQGRFIFVDKEAIRSADSLSGERWRLYFDNQRVILDRKLNIPEMVISTQRGPTPAP